VFQGPPGAGKTALLARLVSEAEAVGWRCVEIDPQALAEPDVMAQSLGNAYVQRRGESVDADAMFVKSGLDKTIAGTRTVGGILRDCLSRRARLVLILDEAQHLGDPMSQVRAESLRDALKSIMNGHTGRKTVLLMGGLGHTWDAMRKRGASRLEDDCVRNLGRVSDKTAGLILSDWLDDVGCEPEHRSVWLQTLCALGDNYPQHLILCAKAARTQFDRRGSSPTPTAIQAVQEDVERRKQRSYGDRTKGIHSDSVVALGMLIGAWGRGADYSSNTLIDALSVNVAQTLMTGRECFDTMLARGVLAERDEGGSYCIPIPSMERHLLAKTLALAVTEPSAARVLWDGVVEVVMLRRGRIDVEHRKQIEDLLAPSQGLPAGNGEHELGR